MTSPSPSPEALARIRRFNRAVTAEIGALNDSWLGKGRPLGLARVLATIGREGCELGALRETLALDSGFLSRSLRSLEAEGLIRLLPDPEDGRRRRALPTAAGRAEIADYERLSQRHAQKIHARLPDSPGLLEAMERITLALMRERIALTPAALDAPEARRALGAYYDEVSARFGQRFDPGSPAPDEIVAYAAPRGAFLLARCDGMTAGCGGLRDMAEPGIGEVKRVWVAPTARGLGLAGRIMAALEDRARALGWTRLRLDTADRLPEALALYRRLGWTEIARYNDNPHATHWFEKPLPPVAEPARDR